MIVSKLRNGRVETALAGTTKEYVVLCELVDSTRWCMHGCIPSYSALLSFC